MTIKQETTIAQKKRGQTKAILVYHDITYLHKSTRHTDRVLNV